MLCWIVRFIVKLSLNFFFCLSNLKGRCFWASQILWWILTSSEQKFCFDCKPLLESYLDGIVVLDDLKCSVVLLDLLSCCHWTFSSVYQAWEVDVFEHPRFCDEFSHLVNRSFVWLQASPGVLPRWNKCFRRFKMLCWMVRFIVKLSLNFFFCLWSVRGRCFWASQILWWTLTSSERKFCFDCKPLLESYLDGIAVLSDLKSSLELLNLLSSCDWTVSSVYQACAVDVFEHPRFCDEFSHVVNKSFVSTATLSRSLSSM